jgi:hypothetical protein
LDLPLKGCVKVVTPARRFIIVRGFYNIGPTIFQCGVFGWDAVLMSVVIISM